MTVRLTQWRGALPRAVLLAVAASLVPVYAVASEPAPGQKARSFQASIRDAVAREVAAMPAAPVATAKARAAQASGSKDSGAFFKTGPGIATLLVMAVGVGYAIYSTQHDRVKSPARE